MEKKMRDASSIVPVPEKSLGKPGDAIGPRTVSGQMKFRRVCDAAAYWLRKTDNPAVGHGDAHLLHEIATLMGWKHASWRTELRVLNALSKTPGDLIPTFVRHHGLVRNFYLPEKCPDNLRP